MPRIYRVRVHNIHFEAGGQPRLYHDTVFEPRGENSLLLLGNGGGKTLLLHLIAQVVEPNVVLQERRIKRLVEKEKFTGHVLVEWLLDGEVPRFLLTGFCFADHLGGAQREMDYFNYLYEYGGRNDWDLLSFPLTDEKGRTLNLKQLSDRLADSPVKVFHHYRRQEYQEKLKSYHLDPREWKYIIRINDSEGGVEKFFEGCSKTRTLMDRLLIPMIDEVLERREERDPLREAFRSTAREVMILPELKIQSEALQALAGRLPRLTGELAALEKELQKENSLRLWRKRTLKTLYRSLPLLEEEKKQLEQQILGKENAMRQARLGLQAIEVEAKRREWKKLEEKCRQLEEKRQAAQNAWEQQRKRWQRLKACDRWGRILEIKEELTLYQEQLRRQEEGDREFFSRLEAARDEVAPLLLKGLEESEKEEIRLRQTLAQLEGEKAKLEKQREEHKKKLEEIEKNLFHLKQQELEFRGEQQKTSAKMQSFGAPFQAEDPGKSLALCREQLGALQMAVKEAERKIQEASASLRELEAEHSEERLKERELAQNFAQQEKAFQRWQEERRLLQAELRAHACPYDPGEDLAAARIWLLQKEEKLLEERREGERESSYLEEQQRLWDEKEGLRPNVEIGRVVEVLAREGVACRSAMELMQELPESKRREMIESRPWLPYSIVVEPAQLEKLKEKKFFYPRELYIPVPLLSRLSFHTGASAGELYFLSHRGLELYISREKALAYFQKIAGELQSIKVKLEALREESIRVRELCSSLDAFQSRYPFSSAAEWEKALRQAEEKLWQQQNRCLEKAKQLEAAQKALQEKYKEREERQNSLGVWEKALDCLQEYIERWEKSLRRREKIRTLEEQKEAEEAGIRVAVKEIENKTHFLAEAQEAQEKVRAALDKYGEIKLRCFPDEEALRAAAFKMQGLSWGKEAQSLLEEKTAKLLAMLEAREQSQQGYREMKRQIERLQRQIKQQEDDIRELGEDPEAVAAYFRPVTSGEIEKARLLESRAREVLEKSQKELQDNEKKTEAAYQVYQDRLRKLKEAFPGERLPELAGEDLEAKTKELQSALYELQKEREKLEIQKNERCTWTEDYLRARDELEGEKSDLEVEVEPWSLEEEISFLRGKAYSAVKDNDKRLNEASLAVQEKKQGCIKALKSCEEELLKLHGEELKTFFRSMELQMSSPRWEEQVAELQGFLNQARQAIEHFQQQVSQRLEGVTRKVEEIVRRCWRHVDSLLEQLRELQRRSAVPLRGEKLHLFQIIFQKPAEEEGQKALFQYLENIIREATRRREQGESDEAIDAFLQEAVQTSQLLNQVIPLDDFKIRLLKPRDDDGSYGSGRYDRWDDLNDWSQGQRFAGRFALFIVLLSYLRECRAKGRRTWSAVLADNPFGKASSSHILEIISAISQQQNVQLFCCTALRNTEIMREFPVIYSLVPVATMGGKERILISSHYRHGESYHVLEQAHSRIPRDPTGEIGQLELF